MDSGWEWEIRRAALLFVSQRLDCAGFLVFVYDGDYWGYEFFNRGVALDHFVQAEEWDEGYPITWFEEDCAGDANVVARELPHLEVSDIAPYLMRDPLWATATEAEKRWNAEERMDERNPHSEGRWEAQKLLNVPAREGDEFSRFEECAALDFLRMLGVRVELRERYVTFLSPKYRSFWISDQNTHRLHDKRYKD